MIGYGNTSVSDRGRTVRELELDQATVYVRQAISRRFKDLHKLRFHPDSTFLLSRGCQSFHHGYGIPGSAVR